MRVAQTCDAGETGDGKRSELSLVMAESIGDLQRAELISSESFEKTRKEQEIHRPQDSSHPEFVPEILPQTRCAAKSQQIGALLDRIHRNRPLSEHPEMVRFVSPVALLVRTPSPHRQSCKNHSALVVV